MVKIIALVLIVCLQITLTGCSQSSVRDGASFISENQDDTDKDPSGTEMKKAEYRKISAEKAKEMLDENTGAILLDVRTETEFKEQRISGSILLPDYEVEDKAPDILTDKDALILIYCRSGNRSKSAANTLIAMGYTNVYDFGGINSWPYGTEKD